MRKAGRRWVLLLAASVLTSGCFPDVRLRRLHLELAEQVRTGQIPEADATAEELAVRLADYYGEMDRQTIWQRTAVARTYGNWGRTDRAIELGNQLLADLEQRYGPNDEHTMFGLMGMAEIYTDARRWTEAEQMADRIVALCPSLHADPMRDNDAPGCISFTLSAVARRYADVCAADKAARAYLSPDPVSNALATSGGAVDKMTVLGRWYAAVGDYPEALYYLDRCVDGSRSRYERPGASEEVAWKSKSGDVELVVVDGLRSFGSQSPRCLQDVIEIHQILGNTKKVEELSEWQASMWARGPDLQKSLKKEISFTEMVWHNDGSTARQVHMLAQYYAGKGQTQQSAAAYEAALSLVDRYANSPQRAGAPYPAYGLTEVLLEMSAQYELLQRYDDARAAYQRAVALADTYSCPQHAWRLQSRAGLARMLTLGGHAQEAVERWQDYLAVSTKLRGTEHADYALGLAGLADALEAAGQAIDANQARTKAATLRIAYNQRVAATHDLPLPLLSPPYPAN